MKSILLSLAISASLAPVFAQAPPPNAGLENWTMFSNYETPDNWYTLDSLGANPPFPLSAFIPVLKTTDAASGTYAAKIRAYIGLGTLPGLMVAGPNQTAGFAYTDRPNFFRFMAKYSPLAATSDTATFVVSLTKWNASSSTDSVIGAGVLYITQSIATYSPFSLSINYVSSSIPDTAHISITNCSAAHCHANDTLYVDDMLFSMNVGIEEPSAIENTRIFPNPVSDVSKIEWTMTDLNSYIVIVRDALGRIVCSKKVFGNNTEIDASLLPSGFYLAEVWNGNEIASRGKFQVQK